jgi:hypothetical protein
MFAKQRARNSAGRGVFTFLRAFHYDVARKSQ